MTERPTDQEMAAARTILLAGPKRANGSHGASANGAGGAPFARTDLGNAERLVAYHGEDLRYAPGLGWLIWDGRRFGRDTNGAVMRRAIKTVRSIYAEAQAAEDADERKKLANWAAGSEAERRLRAAVSLAEVHDAVVVHPSALDADPYLLNVANGTLDLRTGGLREHRRSDLLTKLAPVDHDAGAEGDEWGRFLARVTDCDIELHDFLQRAVGYTLSGETCEEVLFFAHGAEATGKSTFIEAIKAMLGDYAATADFETFLARRGDGGVCSDIARLAGGRMVVGLEVDEGKRLAEGLIKQLTGRDTVTARFMYGEFFEFSPRFKLWLAANHRPSVSAADGAIWRRILQVPFTNTIPEGERDPEVKRRLKEVPEVRSAILSWALEGCLAWQRLGLAVPERVRAYTAEYRAENDPIAEWLEACCVIEPGFAATAADLYRSYVEWAKENGEEPPLSQTALGKALGDRGLRKERDRGRRTWLGIAVADASDTSDALFGRVPTAEAGRGNSRENASKRVNVSTDEAPG